MQSSFQDGVDSIYNAMVAAGATPSSKDPAGIVDAVSASSKYAQCHVNIRFRSWFKDNSGNEDHSSYPTISFDMKNGSISNISNTGCMGTAYNPCEVYIRDVSVTIS